MKKTLVFCLILGVGFAALLGAGCTKKSASATEAIQNSQVMSTVQQKVDYLVAQAKDFYNSKQYQDAAQAAQYVLNKIDKNSQAARDILDKATAQLKAYAQKTTSDMSNKLFGK